jgi:3-hydroxyacyl-CoA dehydrogenase
MVIVNAALEMNFASPTKESPGTDSMVREIIENASRMRGIARRSLAPEEIRNRALLAMANEAALLLAERVAHRPADVDVVLVQGYGFPRWEGGPAFWARQQDRLNLERGFDLLAESCGHGIRRGDIRALLAE